MQQGNVTIPKHARGQCTFLRRAAAPEMQRLRYFVIAFGLALLSAGGPCATALEPTTPLANFGRQGWAPENGLPQNTVQALAQTPDGFLWLGTEVGLVRFDGNGFAIFDQHSRPALPGNDVQCLLAAKDGSLWIGTSDGLARMKNGVVTAFTTANGLPGNSVERLFLNGASVVAVTENGLGKIEAGKATRDTTIYEELMVEPLPDSRFRVTLPNGRLADANATTFAIDQGHGQAIRFRVGRELPGTRIQALIADHSGSLWIGTNSGLVRYSAGKLEKFPVTDPLATASILAILEDREGNLWVGTESTGLQILRDQRFRTLTGRDGLASDNTTAVVEDAAGALWVGTRGSGLTAMRQGVPPRRWGVHEGLLSEVVLSLAAAPNGDLWAGTADGLSRIRHGQVASFTSADGLPDDFIRSLLVDPDGSLWIGTRRGLTHWTNPGDLAFGHMQTFTTANGLGSDLVGAMEHDSAGSLWVATLAGLARLSGGKLTNFATANGLSSNVITAILPREGGSLLIGTQDHGWNLWDGQHFTPVKETGLAATTIHAILDDGLGHLWFATGVGIARCDCGRVMGTMQRADCEHWIEFGTADGLRSRETATNSHPSAWRGR